MTTPPKAKSKLAINPTGHVPSVDPHNMGDVLRLLIQEIRQQVPSAMQHTIDEYHRLIAPALADSGESRFPRSLKLHAAFAHRSQQTGFEHLVFFHIGDAILSFYHAIKTGEIEALDAALGFFSKAAKKGIFTARVEGDLQTGFHLIFPEVKKNAVPAPKAS